MYAIQLVMMGFCPSLVSADVTKTNSSGKAGAIPVLAPMATSVPKNEDGVTSASPRKMPFESTSRI